MRRFPVGWARQTNRMRYLGQVSIVGAFTNEIPKIPVKGGELTIQREGKLKSQQPCQTKNGFFIKKIKIHHVRLLLLIALILSWQVAMFMLVG
jgi:hypothetical protein